MGGAPRNRFVKTTLWLCPLALVIATVVSPPDPITLLLYAAPLVVAAGPVSYLLVYRGGFEYLGMGESARRDS